MSLLLAGALACGGGSSGTQPVDVDTPNADRCEILDPGECLLPFPSDALTREDPATDTGRRVSFARESMPANAGGVHVDPTEWNRNDGFSPGAQITLLVPDVDLAASGLPPVTDLARSLDAGSSLVLLDADTGERVLAWAELDSHAEDPARRALLVHPARSLVEGHRHVVALRGLRTADGAAIEPALVFRVLRDGTPTTNPAIEARRPGMERVLDELEAAGVPRDDLFLAWDFTVASARSLAGRLLHMRDDALATLGGAAPDFEVTGTSEGAAARTVQGTLFVPRYLTGEGEPGSTLNDAGGPDALPSRNGNQSVPFLCTMPLAATPAEPARPSLYGHGLLGSSGEVLGIGQLAALVNVAFCAIDWIGMSAGDIPNVITILSDLSRFRALPDRLLQAHLNFLFLGRALLHPDGFGSHPAFQADGVSALGPDLFFLGASQGGILGGATTAVAQDWTRAVMAVGGANYSLLIPRSVDFDEFEPLLAQSYPDALVRRLGFGLTQMLWDRGEANGYLQHLASDPYPGTPEHDVLYFEAFGDHQVANVATEVAARTIGARVRQPALRAGRSTAVEPFYGLAPVPSYPYPDSALVVWDFGTPAPPDENLPPRAGEDPHGKASEVPAVLVLVSEYLKRDGGLVDVCGGAPCVTLDE